jgi:membrane-associated phospholipid phosphatase
MGGGGTGVRAAAYAAALAGELLALPWLVPLDDRLVRIARAARGCAAERFLTGLCDVVTPAGIALLALGGAVTLTRAPRDWRRALYAVAAVAAGVVLTHALKLLFTRARPAVHDLAHATQSFPSGHTASACLYVAATLVMVEGAVAWRRLVALLGGLWIAAVAFARVYLGYHWPTDVAGTILAMLAYLDLALLHPRAAVRRRTLAVTAAVALVLLALRPVVAGRRIALPASSQAGVPAAMLAACPPPPPPPP